MGGGRLWIRFIIFILIMVLGWKVWEYMDLPPQLDTPPGYPQGKESVSEGEMFYPFSLPWVTLAIVYFHFHLSCCLLVGGSCVCCILYVL